MGLHLQDVDSLTPQRGTDGAEDHVVLPRRNCKARSRSRSKFRPMIRKPTAVYSSLGDADGLCTMGHASALARGDHMIADPFPKPTCLYHGVETSQLPMVLPRRCVTSKKASGSSPGEISNKFKSINAETAGKKQVFDLECLRETLPEGNPPTTVQLLSGRVVWNSNRSPIIQAIQSAAGLHCPLRVYDIKRAVEHECEGDVRPRLALQKMFRSDILEEFHADCSDSAATAPRPLADNVIVPPGTVLTLCRVAEQNEVDEVETMLQSWSMSDAYVFGAM